ncbi:hypothetical protein [Mycolicibacterium phlei]|uniref:hypothetical protein n=1 Tax=Mycolicibacterium phlei TaxID=1771 RepID=UPI000680175D|nr:hypothetical protein [Mycolicibacterium phlei]MBF4194693.1 hypothetical protein [Mycolicibacterium phlei]
MKTRPKLGGFTEGELWLTLRQERNRLMRERAEHVQAIKQRQAEIDRIDERLEQINQSECILEGGL